MEGTNSAGPDRLNRVSSYGLGVVVTLDVLLQVAGRWSRFDLLSHFVAVVLCASLVLLPTLAIWREKKDGRKMSRWQIATAGYMCLMLTLMLFGR
jgi:hypothetical protein